ncbi:MAG: acetoacetyl-CoA synthetase, partial [Actinomycetota bacterium]|nr:acetoacetyl-CoA synthetase [Actinomycetota bacterium]
GTRLDERLGDQIRAAIRAAASSRHVPDEIIEVPGLPHTLTGKRLEVPVKRILMGHDIDDVVSSSAVDRPEFLRALVDRRPVSAGAR